MDIESTNGRQYRTTIETLDFDAAQTLDVTLYSTLDSNITFAVMPAVKLGMDFRDLVELVCNNMYPRPSVRPTADRVLMIVALDDDLSNIFDVYAISTLRIEESVDGTVFSDDRYDVSSLETEIDKARLHRMLQEEAEMVDVCSKSIATIVHTSSRIVKLREPRGD